MQQTEGGIHFNGEMWKQSKCETCECHFGKIVCTTSPNCDPVVTPTGCLYNGTTYRIASILFKDDCNQCYCALSGKVQCTMDKCNKCNVRGIEYN